MEDSAKARSNYPNYIVSARVRNQSATVSSKIKVRKITPI